MNRFSRTIGITLHLAPWVMQGDMGGTRRFDSAGETIVFSEFERL